MSVSWPHFVLLKDVLEAQDHLLMRSVVTGLVGNEIFHFIRQLPSLFHLVVRQKPLEKRGLLSCILPINRVIYLSFDVVGEGLAIVSQIFKSFGFLLQCLEVGQSLNFPECFLEALIVAYLPIVLFFQHSISVLHINQYLPGLEQCIFQDLIIYF